MICHWKGCGQWDQPWTHLPAAGHPCCWSSLQLSHHTPAFSHKREDIFSTPEQEKIVVYRWWFLFNPRRHGTVSKLHSRNASEADSQSKSSLCSLGWEGNRCYDRKKEVLSQELSTCDKSTSLQRVLITFSSEKENRLRMRHREGVPSALWKWEKRAERLCEQ